MNYKNERIFNERIFGFGLMEVLIALLIISFGFLGIAGLNASYQLVQSSIQRQTAATLALDLANRVRMNRGMAQSYINLPVPPTLSKNCETAACSASELPQYDWFLAWTQTRLALPSGKIHLCVSNMGKSSNVCGDNNAVISCNNADVNEKLMQNPNRINNDVCGGTTMATSKLYMITVNWIGLNGKVERYVTTFTP